MLPDMNSFKRLPPFILTEIAENLRDLAQQVEAAARQSIDTTEAKISEVQRKHDLRFCCQEINHELDKGGDLYPAISRVYQRLRCNAFSLHDLQWYWLNVGRHTRPKRQRLARDRRIMELYRSGLSDSDISRQMNKESPAWSELHPKTVSRVRRDIIKRTERGQRTQL